MRPVNFADLEAGARFLSHLPHEERVKVAGMLLDQAAIADAFRQRFRRPHPSFGTGTLMSAITHSRTNMQIEDNSDEFVPCLNILTTVLLDAGNDQMT